MEAGYGNVVNIRSVPSRGVTQVIIECPSEQHVALTTLLFEKDVLVTVATDAVRQQIKSYGVVKSESARKEEQHPTQKLPENKTPSIAQKLYKLGYFFDPKLWAALERSKVWTPSLHDEWICMMPCVFSDNKSWQHTHREVTYCGGDVCGHHVRDASNAGTGIKPHNRFEVPLCFSHHVPLVHDHGTKELKDYLMTVAAKYQQEVIKILIKKYLEIESLSELDKIGLEKWHLIIGYEGHLSI